MLAVRPQLVRFIAKSEFFDIPVVRRMAAWVGAFPIHRNVADMKAVKRSVAMLKRGEHVGIFPEGTRVRDGRERGEPQEGVALIAHLAQADVLPFRLFGTEGICPPGKRLWRFPRVTLVFGQPLSLGDQRYQGMPKDERLSAFTQDCMDAVYKLKVES